MTGPQNLNPDLNPEILLTILKHEIYMNEIHFGSKETLLKVIQEAPKVIPYLQKPQAYSLYGFHIDSACTEETARQVKNYFYYLKNITGVLNH